MFIAFKMTNPDEMTVELRAKMTLKEWKTVAKALQGAEYNHVTDKLLQGIRQIVHDADEQWSNKEDDES